MYYSFKSTPKALSRCRIYQLQQPSILVIAINAVAPGPMLTELMKGYYGEDVFTDHYLNQMPKKQLLKMEEVARVVLFLSSELSDALCGETILADAGRVRLNP